MEVKIGIGIGKLIFGMLKPEVEKLIGKKDKESVDEDDDEVEVIWQFNSLKSRLSFYANEQGRLGYIRCSSTELVYKDHKIIGEKVETVLNLFKKQPDTFWEIEDCDSFIVHSSDSHWLSIHSEYEIVTQLEIGVPFLNDDEYNWPPLRDYSSQLKVVHLRRSSQSSL